ncbi:uncharacterized protein LOC143615268 [Bidens hawaiensis]|uniref:uncharacterized protein LOC143615268 n=1 Tax=Bidens hawaiensis TaxID=980011 RepID=UPI004049FAB0
MAGEEERPIIQPKAIGGISLQVPKLNGTNYITWSIVVEAILDDQGLWEVVQPEEDAAIDAKKNKIVRSFLFQVVEGDIIFQFAQYKNAREIWAALKAQLKAFEERLRGRERASESQSQLLFNRSEGSYKGKSYDQSGSRGRGGQSSWERVRGRETGGQGSYQTEERVREKKDRSQIKCFRCDEMGHFASSCPERRRANQEANLTETKEQADSDPVGYLNLHETVYLNKERVNPKRLEDKKVEEGTWYGSCVDICGKGMILLKSKTGDDRVLSDVYFIPSLKDKIISLGQATENGCDVRMKENYLLLYDDEGKLMMKVFRTRNRLYTIKLTVGVPGYVKKSTPIQEKLNDSETKDDQGKLLFD